jgi:cytochrome c oxidase subunit 4
MSNHDDTHEHHHHITSLKIYHGIFICLLILTVVTVWIAQFDFGVANTFIAMFVASIKAGLVALFFMHLLHDERLNLITFGFGLLFVSLFFLFPLLDITSRDFVDPIKDNQSAFVQKKIMDKQKQHAKKYEKKLEKLGNLYPRSFIIAAEDEKETTKAPVVPADDATQADTADPNQATKPSVVPAPAPTK